MKTITILIIVILATPSFAADFNIEKHVPDIKAALTARSEMLQLVNQVGDMSRPMLSASLGEKRLQFRSYFIIVDKLTVEPSGSHRANTSLKRIYTNAKGQPVAELKYKGDLKGMMEVNLTTGVRFIKEDGGRKETIYIPKLSKRQLKAYGIRRNPPKFGRAKQKMQQRQ